MNETQIKEFIKTVYTNNLKTVNKKYCSYKKMIDAGYKTMADYVLNRVPWAKNITEAMYAFYYDIHTQPLCAKCDTPVKFDGFNKGYKKYCSIYCARGIKKKEKKKMIKNIDELIAFIKNEYFKENGKSPKTKWAKPRSVELIIEKLDILKNLYNDYPWIEYNNFLELAYCVKNNITEQPRCPVCNKPLSFNRVEKKYYKFCSKKCSGEYYKNKIKYIDVDKHDIKRGEILFKDFIKNNVVLDGQRVFFKSEKFAPNFINIDDDIIACVKNRYPWVTSMREAVYCDINNIKSQPVCSRCGKNIKFSCVPNSYGYSKYCSMECLIAASDQKYLYSQDKNTIADFFEFLENHKNCEIESHNLNTLATVLGINKTILPRWLKKYNIHVKDEPIYRSGLEIGLKEFLEKNNIKFLENTRKILNNGYELDFYIPENNLAIEINGTLWHFVDKIAESRYDGDMRLAAKYHFNKFIECKTKKIKLFQIYEHQWRNPVKRRIWESRLAVSLKIKNVKRIYGRKCEIKEISSTEAKCFFDETHLDGGIYARINLGLFYNGKIVAAMSFGKSRFNKKHEKNEWELYRYSTSLYTTVIGGASKLLNFFVKKYTNTGDIIVSFSNNDYSDGGLYKKLGFEFAGYSESFFYADRSNRIYNRLSLQKHKLPKILNIDEKELEYKTANEILEEHGIKKIYTSGQSKWILKLI